MIYINITLFAVITIMIVGLVALVIQEVWKGDKNGSQEKSTPEEVPRKNGNERTNGKTKGRSASKTDEKNA
jgi:hypothetical protein